MDQPVGLSFFGGFLIVLAASVLCTLVAKLVRKTTRLRMLVDIIVGILGGVAVSFILPMNGFVLGHQIGWKATILLGAALPIAAVHMIWNSGTRQ